MKKITAILLSLIMILCLCACQTNPLTGGKNISGLSPNEAVAQAMEQLNTVNSYQLDAEIGFTISAMGQSIKISIALNAEQTQNPETAHLTMALDSGFGTEKMESYVVKDGEQYIVYSGAADGTWTKAVTSQNQSNFDFNLQTDTDYSFAGAETVNGENCNHYVGKISIEKLLAIFDEMDSLDGLGLDSADTGMTAQLDDLPIDVWISLSTGRVSRINVDLMPFIGELLSSLTQNTDVEMEFSDAVMQVDYSRYNELAPIEVPADVIAQAN